MEIIDCRAGGWTNTLIQSDRSLRPFIDMHDDCQRVVVVTYFIHLHISLPLVPVSGRSGT